MRESGSTLHVAFDADDTLWHNESLFADIQERFRALLREHAAPEDVDRRLYATEKRNLRLFGYGVKGFTLSMIETAIELTDRRVSADFIQQIIEWGKWMLDHPVELLPGVPEMVERLAGECPLLLITKGDLFHQESKVARSGLGDRFHALEIVAEKDESTYRRILDRHGIKPERFVMVGNSVKSDILPVIALGGHAVYVPYELTWEHEHASVPDDEPRFHAIESLSALPDVLQRIP